MTKTEKYISLREQGLSYEAIAKLHGVSRQAVHDAIKRYNNHAIHVKPTTVVFQGLRMWMCENHVFVKDLERDTGLFLRNALSNGRINNAKVDAILQLTGLTYEQAFG